MSDVSIAPESERRPPGRPKKVAAPSVDMEDAIPMPGGAKKVRQRRPTVGGTLDMPKWIIDALHASGIDIQWIATSVRGDDQIVRTHVQGYRQDGGWEVVKADMFPYRGKPIFDGMYYEPGYKGEVAVGGQVLHWRPWELTKQALAEMAQEAAQPIEATMRNMKQGIIEGTDGSVTTSTPKAKAWRKLETSVEIPMPD